MLPAWRQSFYIAHWTALDAASTLDAGIRIYPELLVRYQVLVVVGTYYISIGKRYRTLYQFFHSRGFLLYEFTDVWHLLARRLYLALFRLRCV